MDYVMGSSYYRMLLADPIERCGHGSGALKINCHGISTAVLRVKDMSKYASVATATIASTVVRTALRIYTSSPVQCWSPQWRSIFVGVGSLAV